MDTFRVNSYMMKKIRSVAVPPRSPIPSGIGRRVEMPGIEPGSEETPTYKRLVRDKVSLLQSGTQNT